MGGLKSTVLQVGAAMVGAFGLKALTVDFAKSTDQLHQFSSALGVSASDVKGLSNAFEVAGGSAETAFAVLQKIQDAKDALAVKGEAGFLTDAAFSGIDPQAILSGKDAYQSLLNVLKDFDKLSPERQRTLAQTLGVGPAEIALFKKGQGALVQQIELMKKLRPATDEAEIAARKFRSEWALFGVTVGGVADQISVPLVGALGKAAKGAREFIDANRPIIDGTIATSVKFITENFALCAGAAALIGTGIAYF
jgi:nitrate reductase NapE component